MNGKWSNNYQHICFRGEKTQFDDFALKVIAKLLKKKGQGYILEAEVEYPKELHQKKDKGIF